MAENEAAHQHEMEKKAITFAHADAKRGQIYGLLVVCAAFATCCFALYLGYENAAKVIGSTTVVGLVTVFVTGRFIQK